MARTRTATYLPDSRAPLEGEIFKNPALAATYRLLAQTDERAGRNAFYEGELAEQDRRLQRGQWRLAVTAGTSQTTRATGSIRSRQTTAGMMCGNCLPTGKGSPCWHILNLLEPYNIKEMGHNSAEYLHLLIEAKKLAFADRARFYADPSMVDVPVAQLISKEYADTSASANRSQPGRRRGSSR